MENVASVAIAPAAEAGDVISSQVSAATNNITWTAVATEGGGKGGAAASPTVGTRGPLGGGEGGVGVGGYNPSAAELTDAGGFNFGSANAPAATSTTEGFGFGSDARTGGGNENLYSTSSDLQLHKAISENQSTTVLLQMLKDHPDAVQMKDDKGLLPLHRACEHNAPIEVINTLLAAYPEAARLKSLVIESETKK